MKTLLLALSLVLGTLFTSIVSGQDFGPAYNQVYRDTYGNGNGMLIYVGAEWCNPCKQMKAGPLSQIKSNPIFKRYNYIELDVDRDRELVKRLHEGSQLQSLKVPHFLFFSSNNKVKVVEGYTEYSRLESILRANATFYGRPVQP